MPLVPKRLYWLTRLPGWVGRRIARWVQPCDVFAAVARDPALVASLLRLGVLRTQEDHNWMLLKATLLELPELAGILVDRGANPDACMVSQASSTDVLVLRLYSDGPTGTLVEMLKHFLRAGMNLDWRDASGWGLEAIAIKWQVPDIFDRPRAELAHAALQTTAAASHRVHVRRL